MRARALKMIDIVACLIACVIGFILTDKANEVQDLKTLKVYESANCMNLQPVTLLLAMLVPQFSLVFCLTDKYSCTVFIRL